MAQTLHKRRRKNKRLKERHDRVVTNLADILLEEGALHVETFVELPDRELDVIAVYKTHVRIYETKGKDSNWAENKSYNQIPKQLESFYNFFGHMPVRCYYYSPQRTKRVKGFKILVS